MRYKFVAAIVFVILSFSLILPVSANSFGFEIESSDIDKDEYSLRIGLVIRETEVTGKNIRCFAVSPFGMIALGLDDGTSSRKINIYNKDGIFQYGYEFSIHGSFGLEWDENNLVICTVRGNNRVIFDRNGKCIELVKIRKTKANSEYWKKEILSRKKNFENDQYIIRSPIRIWNMLIHSHNSQLVKVDSFGNEIILYDSSKQQLQSIIIWGLVVVLFLICFIVSMIKLLKRTLSGYYQSNIK